MRQIAQRAEVSVGLINHHFGSKEGLRRACDEWVLDYFFREEMLVVASGSLPELRRYVAEHPSLAPMLAYLTRALRDGGPIADSVFDALASLTRDLSREGVKAGRLTPSQDEEGRAALLVAYGAGVLLLADQVARHLGGTDLMDPQVQDRYARVSLEIFTGGVMAEDAFSVTEE